MIFFTTRDFSSFKLTKDYNFKCLLQVLSEAREKKPHSSAKLDVHYIWGLIQKQMIKTSVGICFNKSVKGWTFQSCVGINSLFFRRNGSLTVQCVRFVIHQCSCACSQWFCQWCCTCTWHHPHVCLSSDPPAMNNRSIQGPPSIPHLTADD